VAMRPALAVATRILSLHPPLAQIPTWAAPSSDPHPGPASSSTPLQPPNHNPTDHPRANPRPTASHGKHRPPPPPQISGHSPPPTEKGLAASFPTPRARRPRPREGSSRSPRARPGAQPVSCPWGSLQQEAILLGGRSPGLYYRSSLSSLAVCHRAQDCGSWIADARG